MKQLTPKETEPLYRVFFRGFFVGFFLLFFEACNVISNQKWLDVHLTYFDNHLQRIILNLWIMHKHLIWRSH